MCLSFLICNEKVKNKNYMPHESVEGPTFTADQSSNPKISLTLYFAQHGFKVMRKKTPIILYLQYTEISFKLIRN